MINVDELKKVRDWLKTVDTKKLSFRLNPDVCIVEYKDGFEGDVGTLVAMHLWNEPADKLANIGHPGIFRMWYDKLGVRGDFYQDFVDLEPIFDQDIVSPDVTASDYAKTLDLFIENGCVNIFWYWWIEKNT